MHVLIGTLTTMPTCLVGGTELSSSLLRGHALATFALHYIAGALVGENLDSFYHPEA